MNNFNSDLYRGSIDTIILNLLYEKDSYGYEILKEVNDNAGGKFELKRPTLYSALKRLEKQGFVKAYLKDEYNEKGGQRKYYTLTELGKEQFEKNKNEWLSSKTVIDNLVSSPNSIKEQENASTFEEREDTTEEISTDSESDFSFSNAATVGEVVSSILEEQEEENENKYDKYYVKGVLTKDIYSGKSILDNAEEDENKFDKYYVKGSLEKDIYSGEKVEQPTNDLDSINAESDNLIEQIQNLYDEQNTTENVENNNFFFSSNELDNYEEEQPIQAQNNYNVQAFQNLAEEPKEEPIQEEIVRNEETEFTMYSDDFATTTTSMFDKKAIETQLKKFENNEEDLYSNVNDYSLDNFKPNYVQESMDFDKGYIIGAVDKEEEYTRERDYKQIFSDLLPPKKQEVTESAEEIEIEETLAPTEQASPNTQEETEFVKTIDKNAVVPNKVIDYESLKSELLVEGIKLKEYQDSLQGDRNIILRNKVLFFTLMILSLMMLVELITIYFTSSNALGYGMVFYGVCAGILFIPFIVGTIIFLKNRACKMKDRFSLKKQLLISSMVFIWSAIVVILFAMILKVNFANLKEILTYVIIPIMFLAHYPIGILIYYFMKKGKSFHVQ